MLCPTAVLHSVVYLLENSCNLWEVDTEIVFQQQIPSLLPFVPILKGGNRVAVVQQRVSLMLEGDRLLIYHHLNKVSSVRAASRTED